MAVPEEILLEVRIELEQLVNTRAMMIAANSMLPYKYDEKNFKTLGKRYTNLRERLIMLIQKVHVLTRSFKYEGVLLI